MLSNKKLQLQLMKNVTFFLHFFHQLFSKIFEVLKRIIVQLWSCAPLLTTQLAKKQEVALLLV